MNNRYITFSIFYLMNLIFFNLFFFFSTSSQAYDFTENLKFLKEDLARISFPYETSLSSMILVIFISLFLSFIQNIQFKQFFTVDIVRKLILICYFVLENLLVVVFVFYFFRIFKFPRLFLISQSLVWAIYSVLIFYFINQFRVITKNLLNIKNYRNTGVILILIPVVALTVFTFRRFNLSPELEYSIENSIEINNTTGGGDSLNIIKCNEWLGSNHTVECITNLYYKKIELNNGKTFQDINNLVVFNDNTFVLESRGLVYNLTKKTEFLNINKLVNSREGLSGEHGLWDIAFHPSEKYFLITYSDTENNYVISKYFYENLDSVFEQTPEIMVKIPNTIEKHYSGSLIYSKFFEDFLYSVGDMNENQYAEINPNPVDTSSNKGKILFLNNKNSKPKKITSEINNEARNDLLAFGLRNPWQIYEYNNYLIVPDIGRVYIEELNLVDLNLFKDSYEPYLFGWPYFEGNLENEIPFDGVELWDSSEISAREYIINQSLEPVLYYDHDSPDVFRAAIIFGGVIQNKNNPYYESLVFADYNSREIFLYKMNENILTIANLPNEIINEIEAITSISIIQNTDEYVSLLLATNDSLFEVSLLDD